MVTSLNIDKAIEKGKKLVGGSGYGLTMELTIKLCKSDDDWDKVCNAFFLGVCQGAKVARKQMKGKPMKRETRAEIRRIMEMLNQADERCLKLICTYAQALIGKKDPQNQNTPDD